jgi:hypothetical protein
MYRNPDKIPKINCAQGKMYTSFNQPLKTNQGQHSESGIGYLHPLSFETILSYKKRKNQLSRINLRISGNSLNQVRGKGYEN